MTPVGTTMRVAGLVAVLALLLGSCSGDENKAQAASGDTIESPVLTIPRQVLGLDVSLEDVSEQVEAVDQSYVDSVGMFAFREDKLLRATLQVNRLNRFARPSSDSFRKEIVGLLGGSTPVQLMVGERLIFTTTGNQQSIFAWFNDRGLYVLSVHRDYPFPFGLVRRLSTLELN